MEHGLIVATEAAAVSVRGDRSSVGAARCKTRRGGAPLPGVGDGDLPQAPEQTGVVLSGPLVPLRVRHPLELDTAQLEGAIRRRRTLRRHSLIANGVEVALRPGQ